jgi:hypothetical protein
MTTSTTSRIKSEEMAELLKGLTTPIPRLSQDVHSHLVKNDAEGTVTHRTTKQRTNVVNIHSSSGPAVIREAAVRVHIIVEIFD